MGKISYVEAMRKLNEAIPQTTDLDYRTVDPTELWTRINNLLKDLGILKKITPEEYDKLKFSVVYIQGKNFCLSPVMSQDVDQNDQHIKSGIVSLKMRLYDIIQEYGEFDASLGNLGTRARYGDGIGSTREIEEFTTLPNVEEYISKMLTVSKSITDKEDVIDYELIAEDILNQFGLSTVGSSTNLQYKILIDAIKNAITYSIYTDATEAKERRSDAVYYIAENIWRISRKNLERKARRDASKKAVETQDAAVVEYVFKEPTANKEAVSFEELDGIIRLYSELRQRQMRNEEIERSLHSIEEQRKELDEQQRNLEEERKNNCEVISKAMKYGNK